MRSPACGDGSTAWRKRRRTSSAATASLRASGDRRHARPLRDARKIAVMRTYVTVALCAVALFACQQKSGAARPGRTTRVKPSDLRNVKVNEVIQPAPQFVDHALLG